MDTDLFQILTLILLLGLLLTLFGLLQSLGAIRKLLEGGAPSPAASPAPAPEAVADVGAAEPDQQPSTWAHPSETAQPVVAEAEPARTGWPAPQEAAGGLETSITPEEAAAGVPAPTGTGAGRVLYGDTGLTTATPNESALEPGATPEPATVEPEPLPTTAQAEPQPSTVEDPQEQPFERDGRWWFRRGDELLVYEEQTGQWVAAPDPSSSGSVAAAAPAASATATETSAGPAEGQVTVQQEAVGSFWKCPSCGAVNGSTATSCRMCFTARP